MNRDIVKKIARKGSEKGVAIVFVLGIMGLLMVIGLGFAATSMLDSKIAANTGNNETAKTFARSAFERAYLLLKNNAEVDKIVSRAPGTGTGDYDFLWKLNLVQDGLEIGTVEIDGLPAQSGVYKPDTAANVPSWQYLKRDGKYIGRFAYKCYTSSGALDPSVHYGKHAAEGSAAPALPRFGTFEWEVDFRNALKTATQSIYRVEDVKKGFDFIANTANSVNLKYPYRFPSMRAFLSKLDLLVNSAERLEAQTDMVRNLQTGHYPAPEAFWIDKNDDGKQTKDELFHRFNLARTDWDDTSFDDVNRLFGYDKSSGAYAANANVDAESNAIKYETKPVLTGSNLFTGGIQWFGKWENVSSPADWTDHLRRRQIAANIIQYCRKGDSVTVSDVNWEDVNIQETASTASDKGGFLEETALPSYAGVGKHPLLNEAVIKLSVIGDVQAEDITNGAGTPRWKYTWSYAPEIEIGAEVIDIFGIPAAQRKNARIYMKGNVEFEYANPNPDAIANPDPYAAKFTHSIAFTAAGSDPGYWTVTKDDWGTGTDFGYTLPSRTDPGTGNTLFNFWKSREVVPVEGVFEMDGTDATNLPTIKANLKVRNVKIKIEKLVLKYEDSTGVFRSRDFARLDYEKVCDSEIQVEAQKYFFIGVEAQDPRVNHYRSDWRQFFSTDSGGTNFVPMDANDYTGSPGKKNTITLPAVRDAESSVDSDPDPAASGDNAPRISTAYIAQKPMRSLWELGAVSRAEAFRTINLGKTRPYSDTAKYRSGNKGHAFAFGDEGYNHGDGNILDQVKIHVLEETTDLDRTSTYGKVNINTLHHGPLQALFQGVTLVDSGKTANEYFDPVQNNTAESGTLYDMNSPAAFCLDHDGTKTDFCIACMIRSQALVSNMNVRFMTRSDLLLPDTTHGIWERFAANKDGSAFTSDAAKEQLIGKTVNLMTAQKPDLVYVVALAQTIKEVSAGTYYVDWTGNGQYNNGEVPSPPSPRTFFTTSNMNSNVFRAYRKLGYIRPVMLKERFTHPVFTDYATGNKYRFFSSTAVTPVEMIIKQPGDVGNWFKAGADKITGTSRLVAVLEWDHGAQKWKIRSMSYGE